MTHENHCDYCNAPSRKRFCSDKCRGAWHREHDPHGTVRSVRRLANGNTAVVVHFAEHEAERALHLAVRQPVTLGALAASERST